MFELTNILIFGAGVAGGAFLGVLLGRRSTTANETVDRIRAEYDRRVSDLQRRVDEYKARDQG